MRFLSKKALLLAALCVITFVAASKAERYVIAYLPSGNGWHSRVILSNPGLKPVGAEIKFFLADGREAETPTKGLRLDVRPRGVQTVEPVAAAADSDSPIAWATVEASAPLQVYSFSAATTGPLITHPGPPPCIPAGPFHGKPPCVPPSTPRTTPHSRVSISASSVLPEGRGFQLPMTIRRSVTNARLVLANPTDTTATIQVTLVPADGFEQATRIIQISPHARTDGLVTDHALFEPELDSLDAFDGTLVICSNVPIGMLALGVEGDMAFTLPVSPRAGCPGDVQVK